MTHSYLLSIVTSLNESFEKLLKYLLSQCNQISLYQFQRYVKYIECTSYNTFYPFQNKHQVHWHLQSV